jgi:DNA replication protein DnaC
MLLLELGYLPIDNRGVDLVFQVVSARYESESIVLATNRAFNDRGKIIDVDNTLTTATIGSADTTPGGASHTRRQLSHER